MAQQASAADRHRQHKLSIVQAYDACAGDGDKGALLRREGLYSSHIVEWRRARDAAGRAAAEPRSGWPLNEAPHGRRD